MAAGRCDLCGVEEYMPYVCKFCKGRYCAAHRLPENHGCQGLDAYKDRVRAEGRVFAPAQESPMTPRVSTTARAGASMEALWSRIDGKMTWILVGAIVATFVLEYAVLLTSGEDAFTNVFVITPEFLTRPWTVVTSVFAHDPFNFSHLFVNGLVLVFFGQTTERLIGTRRFTYLFLGAGILAGIAQVVFTMLVFPGEPTGALGASGAIQGVMGTLVVLAPTLTVLVFFVIPAPLWALTIFYVIYDLFFNVFGRSGVAGVAHLAGLAVGLGYGYYLRKKGLRAVVRRAPPMWNR
jgi:uncharacterized protein